eukprot:356166-Chlamydomonas_euryale.AAC.2
MHERVHAHTNARTHARMRTHAQTYSAHVRALSSTPGGTAQGRAAVHAHALRRHRPRRAPPSSCIVQRIGSTHNTTMGPLVHPTGLGKVWVRWVWSRWVWRLRR